MIDAEEFLRGNPMAIGSGEVEGSGRRPSAVKERSRSRSGMVLAPRRRPRMVGRVTMIDEALAGDADACREAALRLLESAPRCSGGLRGRLLDKGFEEPVVDDVVLRLMRVGLVDDAEYARSMVRHCLGRQMGERAMVMEMRLKGVDDANIRMSVGEARSAGAFERAAFELGEKVAARTRGLDRQVRLRRFWSAGARKGHDPQTLGRVAGELFPEG